MRGVTYKLTIPAAGLAADPPTPTRDLDKKVIQAVGTFGPGDASYDVEGTVDGTVWVKDQTIAAAGIVQVTSWYAAIRLKAGAGTAATRFTLGGFDVLAS